MKLFTNKKTVGYIIIIGCGRLGANLANTLSDGSGNIIVIDRNPDAFHKLTPSFSGIAMTGDATEMYVLNNAKIEKAAAVISVTNNDNTNIMVAQIAKKLFNIRRVLARLYDPERESVYLEFGINIIPPAVLSTNDIDKLLNISEMGAEVV